MRVPIAVNIYNSYAHYKYNQTWCYNRETPRLYNFVDLKADDKTQTNVCRSKKFRLRVRQAARRQAHVMAMGIDINPSLATSIDNVAQWNYWHNR